MADEAQILETLTEIFRSELDSPKLTLTMASSQANISDWDSLAHVRIVMSVERAFHIQLEVNEIEEINSVRGLYDAVIRHSR